MSNTSTQFYTDLPEQRVNTISQLATYYREYKTYFTAVPDDWWVIITDIKGSTRLTEAGHGEKINHIAAKTIAAVVNEACGKAIHVPFVYGGDGGTILIPPVLLEQTGRNLTAIEQDAYENEHIALRVGAVSMRHLRNRGHDIHTLKTSIAGHQSAQFIGSGMYQAEKILKDADTQTHPEDAILWSHHTHGIHPHPDLSYLVCPYNPIKTKDNRTIAVFLIEPCHRSPAHIADILEQMATIMPNIHDISPFTKESLLMTLKNQDTTYKQQLSTNLDIEYATHGKYYAKVDQIKIDHMIRGIVAITPDQYQRLTRLLTTHEQQGSICYAMKIGTHIRMICNVPSADAESHWIDGTDDYTYTHVAKVFKTKKENHPTKSPFHDTIHIP